MDTISYTPTLDQIILAHTNCWMAGFCNKHKYINALAEATFSFKQGYYERLEKSATPTVQSTSTLIVSHPPRCIAFLDPEPRVNVQASATVIEEDVSKGEMIGCRLQQMMDDESSDEDDTFSNYNENLPTSNYTAGYYTSCGRAYDSLSDVPVGALATFHPLVLGGVGGRKRGKVYKGRKRPKRQGRRQPTTDRELVSSNLNVPRTLTPQYAPNSWSYISSVSSDASGRFNFYCNIRNPAKAINGSGQYRRAVEDAKLWDGYYVKDFIIQMKPIIPTTVTAGLVMGAIDQEGISPAATPTYDELVDRRYRFQFDGRQTKIMTIRPKILTSGTFEGRVCPIIMSGKKIFYDFEFPPDQGIVEVAGEGFPASSALFQIFLWMNVINFGPRTLPGTQPRVPQVTSDGRYLPNPLPVLPLRRRAASV